MDRRSFIKLTAVTGTSATLASCGNPDHQLIRFVPDDDLTPGIAEWKPGVCALCSAGCGLTVRVMDADVEVVRDGQQGVTRMNVAKKLEGNPAHPINQGKLCARGQAGVQVTYHPDRLTGPIKRSGPRGSGQFEAISWDQALEAVLARLDALEAEGRQRALAFWSRPRRSLRRELVALFLSRFGAPPPVEFELFGDDVLRSANLLSFGREQLPTIDLERSRYVLSFGADLLGTWNSPVAQNVAYGRMRQGHPGVRGKFVQIEPRLSQTGANADEWIPIQPGTEGVFALGLAHLILGAKLRPASAAGAAGALIDGWSAGLPDYTPERVQQRTGVPAARLERLAREFADAQPAVAVSGGGALAHTNGLGQALAVNALNALAGTVGQAGGVFFTPQIRLPAIAKESRPNAVAAAARSLEAIAADLRENPQPPIEVLFLDDVNPVFAAPAAWRLTEAIEKIPFIVSFGSFLDETSVLADLVLPDHSFLESWIATLPESGSIGAVATIGAPVMRPLHQTRATPDVLLDLGRRLKRPLSPALPWQTIDEMLQAGFGDAWSDGQVQGGIWGARVPAAAIVTSAAKPGGRASGLADAQFDGSADDYPFHFLPYPSTAFLDGSLAHLPWLQELPDPITSAMWSSWIEINPATAGRLGISQGDLVEITSRQGSVRAPALLWPGIAPGVVAMPAGQGHRTFTRYASGRGANPLAILAAMKDSATGALAWAATRVKIARVSGPDGSLVMFAGEMRERPNEGR